MATEYTKAKSISPYIKKTLEQGEYTGTCNNMDLITN